ncbi:VENN motif pre-toxin domain-containing protein, partial [Serratia odorifera]
QLIAEIGSQAADIARTQGDINGLSEAKKQHPGLSADELRKTDTYKAEMAKYGTGSALQRGMQAATAVIQGLAGGDIAKAVAGGAAPYIANIIGSSGLDDAGKVMAHAAVNAALAAAQGNNALAGAAGAATAELAGMIALDVYGKSAGELSESEKQTVSALVTLAAGLAGGLAGNSAADAVAGAQAGQTTVSNNLFGGNEESQTKFVQEHGKGVLSCTEAPSSASCQRGEAVNKAIAGALATGGVALLPGSAQAMWGLGAGVNAGAQYAEDGKVNPVNSVVAGWTNVISMGNGLWGTVGWNAAGGALTSQINGDNPLTGAITNGAEAALGYGFGKVATSVTNSAGKWITGGWDPKFNPDLLKYTEIKGQLGISKEKLPSKLPSVAGNITSSISSESGSNTVQKLIDGRGEK